MSQIKAKVLHSIRKKGRGWVFCAKNFLNISHRNTLDKLLHRLEKQSIIRHIGWGLYDYPILNKEGKAEEPNLETLIKALEVQLGDNFQYCGHYSAYLLGLDAKPTQITYLSNKRAHKFKICSYDIRIKKTALNAPKNRNDKAILAIQSLIYLGKEKLDDDLLLKIFSQLDVKEKKRLKNLLKDSPVWLSNALNKKL